MTDWISPLSWFTLKSILYKGNINNHSKNIQEVIQAQKELNAFGFIGTANDATAHFFGKNKGMGTMPHALVGYAGSTLAAAKLFYKANANQLPPFVEFMWIIFRNKSIPNRTIN